MLNSKKIVRQEFRTAVFKRDNYICRICGKIYSKEESEPQLAIINAHHIIDRKLMPNGGYVVENGITVCDVNGHFEGDVSCHMQVEQWHISGGDTSKVRDNLRPDYLYQLVSSSYELAYESSKALSEKHLRKK